MFGVSFTELMLIGVVALIVVGPQRLPSMMANVGKWSSKLRRMLFDVRQQSGIDDILRAEGITGGINEIRALRNAVRGNVQSLAQTFTRAPNAASTTVAATAPGANPKPAGVAAVSPATAAPTLAVESDPYANVPYDRSREYPDEGCDAYGAIADDLWAATQRPVKSVEPDPEPVIETLEAAPTVSAISEAVPAGANGLAAPTQELASTTELPPPAEADTTSMLDGQASPPTIQVAEPNSAHDDPSPGTQPLPNDAADPTASRAP